MAFRISFVAPTRDPPPGINVDAKERSGLTALHIAAETGSAAVVALLLAKPDEGRVYSYSCRPLFFHSGFSGLIRVPAGK